MNPTAIRLLRLAGFALLVGAILALSVVFALAWGYVTLLTRPGCQAPSLPGAFPAPQEVALVTSDDVRVRAWYYPSRNRAALLALGGPTGALGLHQPPVLFLVEQGFGALQVDTRACASPTRPVTLGGKELLDAEAGLAFLLAQPEVDRIGVIGFSMGGVTAIRVAARHPEILAVVAEGGFYNLGEDFIEPQTAQPAPVRLLLQAIAGIFWLQTGENPWQISPIDDLPDISPHPVLLIYGEHEAGSGRAQAQYAAAGDPKELWIVPGGGHGTNYALATQAYQARLLDFLTATLLGP